MGDREDFGANRYPRVEPVWSIRRDDLCPIEQAITVRIGHAWYMDFNRSLQAEDTAAILQRAARSGFPVLIPGALERRPGRPAAPPTGAIDRPMTPPAPGEGASDRARLEHEREGGGAPSERSERRHGTLVARLWHRIFRPIDLPVLWRRVLPEHR